MIIYVWKCDYRSYSSSHDSWGGNVISVEVPDDFSGGNKTYNPETGEWIADPPYVRTHEDDVRDAESVRDQLHQRVQVVTQGWAADLGLGDISDEDRAKLVAWRAYDKRLRDKDLSAAPDIEWEDEPEA